MRVLAHDRFEIYAWRRKTARPNGNPRDCNGIQLRLRLGEWWWNAEATSRTIKREWRRGKSQAEVTVFRVGPNGKRDRGYRKRFLRVTVGTGGEGSDGAGGAGR